MISILSDLSVYGSSPELESGHRWVAVIDEVTRNGFFVLTICSKCGMLARKNNSTHWELCKPSDDRWRLNSESLNDCPGYLEEIN
jgi:hypothetical protein